MIIAIAAADLNWGIGYKNDLLCRIPADLKRFKKLTESNVVIMGKNTFLSIGSKPLPYRTNIVITYEYSTPVRDDNGVIYMNMQSAIDYILNNKGISDFITNDIYIIGGASIYKQLLTYCDKVLLTRIFKEFPADAYFPNLDENPKWQLTEEERGGSHKDFEYWFMTYEKVPRC